MEKCDNYSLCEKFIVERIYTIPLTHDWRMTTGGYCSLECALFVNKTFVGTDMPRCDAEKREFWMREKYSKKR
jgi:hypothetical protein